ncbi:leucine-rich repeat protein [Acinetobacter schindleri]|uniref:leucine-rich repeat domain-containing protein n=1 Tax=Acinetobacter schindleri TaxID=108981 RepID=UPI0034D63D0F
MSVADKIRSLIQIKAQLQTAIKAKGVAVENNTPFSEYPGKISAIAAMNPDNGGFTHTLSASGSMQVTKFIMPKGVTALNTNELPSTVEEVVLPEGFTTLNANAFANYSRLKKVVMPSTLKTIPVSAASVFSGCTALEELNLQYVESLYGLSTFYNAGLKSIDLSSLITPALPSNTFSGCKSLHTVILGQGIKTLDSNCFQDCTALENIDLTNIETIGTSAFRNTNLKRLHLPNCINFSSQALYEMPLLEEVIFSNKLTSLRQTFSNRNALKSLIFPPNFTTFPAGISIIAIEAKYLKYIDLGNRLNNIYYNLISPSLPAIEAVRVGNPVPPYSNSTSPPFLIPANMQSIFKIYVPDGSVEAYKMADGWKSMAQYIRPMSEFVMPVL